MSPRRHLLPLFSLVLAALTLVVLSSPASGAMGAGLRDNDVADGTDRDDPGDWLAEFGPQGTNGDVRAIVEYGGAAVFGGSFTWAGNGPCRNVVRDEGGAWLPLGGGIGGVEGACVYALAVYGGDLIAGGLFSEAGGVPAANIARWDGSAWTPFAGGMNGAVRVLAIVDRRLVAGGDFTLAGTTEAAHIAAWDGAAWQPFGSGLDGTVQALAWYNGSLAAGGTFHHAGGTGADHIARWDGLEWLSLGTGTDGDVNALLVYEGDLLAGGAFLHAGGLSAPRFARWHDGQWISTGVLSFSEGNQRFNAMTLVDGNLVVGGLFTYGEQKRSEYVPSNVLLYDGSFSWTDMDCGVDDEVYCLAVCRGRLLAGGEFRHTIRRRLTSRIACWNPVTWQWDRLGEATAIDPRVYTMSFYGNDLIAGGSMQGAGGEVVGCFARWDGARWAGFGTVSDGPVSALLPYGGDLIMGGSFYWVDGTVPARGLGRWNGTAWGTLGGGLDYQAGWSASVHDLLEHEGDLVVGGHFYGAGGVASPNVVRWDGTAWQPMGAGLPQTVIALTSHAGDVVAATWYTQAVYRYANGAWNQLGGTFSGYVRTLADYHGELIAGGHLTAAGSIPLQGMARWNGTSWEAFPLAPGLDVFDMEVHGDRLVVTGTFPGGAMSWDGTSWTPLDCQLDPEAMVCTALSANDGADLYLGGEFEVLSEPVSYNLTHRHRTPSDVPDPAGRRPATTLVFCPNPCPAGADLRLRLALNPEPVRFTLHDAAGRLVRTLWDGPVPRATEVRFDARSQSGIPLAAGAYFGRLVNGERIEVGRVTVVP